MQSASADFPIDGRAATMMRLPGWNPDVSRSRVAEAGRRAGEVDARFVQRRDALEALLEQLLDLRPFAGDALLREVVQDLLRLVDEVAGLAGAFPPQARDLAAGADEPAQRCRLVDDPCVVGRVRGGRDERRELVQADAPADGLDLAALLELIGERDRVDRLALRVEREGGAIDLRVRLAVEVAGVDDLADGPDRAGGDHHRAEDTFLGFQVLWGNGGRRSDRGELGHPP